MVETGKTSPLVKATILCLLSLRLSSLLGVLFSSREVVLQLFLLPKQFQISAFDQFLSSWPSLLCPKRGFAQTL